METHANGKKNGRGKVAAEAELPPVEVLEKKAPPPDKGQVIFIPRIEVIQTTIEVRGITPLIVHAWSEKAKKEMRDKQMGVASKKKEFKVPENDFNGARYRDLQGRDCAPALAFKNAAVEAGVLAGVFKTILRKALFVLGDWIPILDQDGQPYSDKGTRPVMREDMVRVGQGTADLRYRPMYEKWSCKVPVEFNPRIISAEQLMNLFDNAGYSIGLCEWRPEKDGQFGRFRVRVG
jgi:hypothetical protein